MNKKFIIAVSGGVDSVVLLDKLAKVKPPTVDYIVAHVDHGIRDDAHEDAQFVRELAQKYGFHFESTQLALGGHASEDTARLARYEFLLRVMRSHKAEGVITAHHQDDAIETMVLHMLRGTGPRGLIGYTSPHIVRPFMTKSKQELLEYAQLHQLKWREDSTNADVAYQRNYIRHKLVPRFTNEDREKLLTLRSRVAELYVEIDIMLKSIFVQTVKAGELKRASFVVLPYAIQQELIAYWLRLHNLAYDKKTIERVVLACKVMQPGKYVDVSGGARLEILKETIRLKVEGPHV